MQLLLAHSNCNSWCFSYLNEVLCCKNMFAFEKNNKDFINAFLKKIPLVTCADLKKVSLVYSFIYCIILMVH
jgi:hypothetical protein